MSSETDVEVAITRGGPAGLSAAPILGRSRRRVVLFDAGDPRNAPASAAHNVYTRDGAPPLGLNRIGREQLAPCRSVEVRRVQVEDAERRDDGTYLLADAGGTQTTAQHVVPATCVVDVLPTIEGLKALWGAGVFHWYCHGWEVQNQHFVLIAQDPRALHGARILRGWTSKITPCPVAGFALPPEEQEALAAAWGSHRAKREGPRGSTRRNGRRRGFDRWDPPRPCGGVHQRPNPPALAAPRETRVLGPHRGNVRWHGEGRRARLRRHPRVVGRR